MKVARQGPGSSKWPWSVPFWRCPRLEAGHSPNSLGVGTRIGSVLAVSMTLRHRSSHRLSEFVLGSASDEVFSIIQGVLGGGLGGAGAGRVTAPVARVAGAAALAPVACAVALRWVSPRLVPPAWRGPLRLAGVPSGSAPGSGTLGGVRCGAVVLGAGECRGEDLRRGEHERREMGLRCDRFCSCHPR